MHGTCIPGLPRLSQAARRISGQVHVESGCAQNGSINTPRFHVRHRRASGDAGGSLAQDKNSERTVKDPSALLCSRAAKSAMWQPTRFVLGSVAAGGARARLSISVSMTCSRARMWQVNAPRSAGSKLPRRYQGSMHILTRHTAAMRTTAARSSAPAACT